MDDRAVIVAHSPTTAEWLARVTRALEAILDGEILFAEQILDDLVTDLERELRREMER